jgi:Wiskott-Aldrich syndrome protein
MRALPYSSQPPRCWVLIDALRAWRRACARAACEGGVRVRLGLTLFAQNKTKQNNATLPPPILQPAPAARPPPLSPPPSRLPPALTHRPPPIHQPAPAARPPPLPPPSSRLPPALTHRPPRPNPPTPRLMSGGRLGLHHCRYPGAWAATAAATPARTPAPHCPTLPALPPGPLAPASAPPHTRPPPPHARLCTTVYRMPG